MIKHLYEAINYLLFSSTALTDIVGNNIHEAAGPVDATWPQVIYFQVARTTGYQLDYNSESIQISCFSTSRAQALNMQDIIYRLFNRYRGIITTFYGDVEINWTDDLGGSYIESADPNLHGYQSRFLFRYRGENIE